MVGSSGKYAVDIKPDTRGAHDGVDGVHVNMTNTMNTPIESLEAYLPMHFVSYGLRPDTGGAGEKRGGCGIERSWTLTAPKATLSILAERTKIRPWGLQEVKAGHWGSISSSRRGAISLRYPQSAPSRSRKVTP
ncbi:MAG: hydantoinase B/oxoprolinase family protein [Candidatus Bathyarchaeia archaeon]